MRGAVACSETDFGPVSPKGESDPAGGGSQDTPPSPPPLKQRVFGI